MKLNEPQKKKIVCIDFGGGWTPEDFMQFLGGECEKICNFSRKTLPNLKNIIFEPGKAITQNAKCLITTVLEKRIKSGNIEIITDSSIAEMPQMHVFPHDIYAVDNEQNLHLIEEGQDRILGRLCMEQDILAVNKSIFPWINKGTKLIILNAGAYDSSMSFKFGQGL